MPNIPDYVKLFLILVGGGYIMDDNGKFTEKMEFNQSLSSA